MFTFKYPIKVFKSIGHGISTAGSKITSKFTKENEENTSKPPDDEEKEVSVIRKSRILKNIFG